MHESAARVLSRKKRRRLGVTLGAQPHAFHQTRNILNLYSTDVGERGEFMLKRDNP